MNGINAQTQTNRIPVTIATIFNFHSIDFLLPYSFHHAENHHIHIPIHHFGDIIKTHAINTHHNITIAIINAVFIIYKL